MNAIEAKPRGNNTRAAVVNVGVKASPTEHSPSPIAASDKKPSLGRGRRASTSEPASDPRPAKDIIKPKAPAPPPNERWASNGNRTEKLKENVNRIAMRINGLYRSGDRRT